MKLSEQRLDPFSVPPGTQVGPWRVKAYEGGGAYGLVFRAVRVGEEQAGDVALKVARYPGEPRFQREVVLLSRVDHPSVPRLLDHGEWQAPGGEAHPYIVMEWVEGLELYAWAQRCNPSSRDVLQVVGQLAGALAATHAAGGVHRDVKDSNIRVRAEGRRAVLMDFGAGTYAGAAPLTRQALPPGTDDYRSPEAWEYELQRPRDAKDTYAAQPADDVFALGVCAYRMVTGWYLPPVVVRPEGPEPGYLEWVVPRPAVEMNPRVAPELSELMVRMLARQPQERPAALELAEALEQVARKAGPGADMPLVVGEEPVAAVESAVPIRRHRRAAEERGASSRRGPPQAHGQAWAVYAACILLGAVISAMAVGWGLWLGQQARGDEGAQPALGRDLQGERPVGLGDASLTAPDKNEKIASGSGNPSRPVPQTPLNEQRRAPHCVPDVEATINGGCWVEAPSEKPPCKPPFYEWQEGCYMPSFPRQRRPTSEPP